MLDNSMLLRNLSVKGEVSNYRPNHTGHMYFSLKDEGALIDCVMFKGYAGKLKFALENGLKIIAAGSVSVYEKTGRYQLYLTDIQPEGIGNLHLAFEQMKEKLKKEGLFESIRKKELPLLPKSVGVITSATGAVIRDIIHVSTRRFPGADIKVLPVPVQGDMAAPAIAKAVRLFNSFERSVDVIMIARGGGSFEDLFPFNEELVARAVYDSSIPVVSAIGHETDYTILDFVADKRAPTPSAAAEMVFPKADELFNTIAVYRKRLNAQLYHVLQIKRTAFERLANANCFRMPYQRILNDRKSLEDLSRRLLLSGQNSFENKNNALRANAMKLDALSPLTVLARGYGVVCSEDEKKMITGGKKVKPGDKIKVIMHDGKLICNVIEKV